MFGFWAKTVRLFVAWLLDDSVRTALNRIQKKLAASCSGVRWVKPEQLHMTVKFLGDVPDAKVKEVTEVVTRSAGVCNPFTITLAGCGCFGPNGPVRIVWVGANETTGTMVQNANRMIGALEKIGFAPEGREWSPHITIGRVRIDRSHGSIRSAVQACTFDELQQSVNKVSVMTSVLSPDGPTYTPINTTDFG